MFFPLSAVIDCPCHDGFGWRAFLWILLLVTLLLRIRILALCDKKATLCTVSLLIITTFMSVTVGTGIAVCNIIVWYFTLWPACVIAVVFIGRHDLSTRNLTRPPCPWPNRHQWYSSICLVPVWLKTVSFSICVLGTRRGRRL